MEIIKGAEASKPAPNVRVNYSALAQAYNKMEVKDLIKLDEPTSNITLFKNTLERRGVRHGIDFRAFTTNGESYVEKLTEAKMEG